MHTHTIVASRFLEGMEGVEAQRREAPRERDQGRVRPWAAPGFLLCGRVGQSKRRAKGRQLSLASSYMGDQLGEQLGQEGAGSRIRGAAAPSR